MSPTAEPRTAPAGIAERYRALLDIGRTLTGTLSPDELYRTIYRETGRVLETAGFFISLYDAGRDLATIVFYADRGVDRRVEISYRGSDSEVIRTGRATLVDDLEASSVMLVREEHGDGTRSAISAPLIHKGQVLGAISSQSHRARAYSPDDLELLQGIADMAVVALVNARTVAALDRQRREAEQIEEIGRALASSLDRQEVLQKVIGAALEVLHADGAAVWLMEHGPVARVAASAGRIEAADDTAWDLSGALERRLIHERSAYLASDLQASADVPAGFRAKQRTGSAIAVPLVVGSDVRGVLTAISAHAGFFDEDESRVLARLASQAAVALENARLHASVQALSLTDPLTGLSNRRHLGMHLEREIAAARRGRTLVVCMHDLDYFKEYNDTAGHLAGDGALRAFAQVLAAENRAMNVAARYGGDEFVSVLTDTTVDGARIYVQRVGGRIEKDPVLGPSGIKVSTGIARFDSDTMKTAADLIQAADAELYKMKGDRKR